MPMSPAPIAPSTASVRACSPTSASEWPARLMLVRDLDAAYPEMIARGEGVDIEALPDADVAEPGGEQPLGGGEILRRRHLQIVLAAFDDQRRHARRLGDRGVVGQVAADGGAVGGEDRIEVKALRRLRPPQGGTVDRSPGSCRLRRV